MKTFKKILLSLMIASSMGAFSCSAFAEASDGRISYSPIDAINLVESKIKIAIDAIAGGADGDSASALIKNAIDATKEINANDKVDMAKQKATGRLKSAKTHAKEAALQEAEQELRDAQKRFEDMKGML